VLHFLALSHGPALVHWQVPSPETFNLPIVSTILTIQQIL
jgi:hypothetical protein